MAEDEQSHDDDQQDDRPRRQQDGDKQPGERDDAPDKKEPDGKDPDEARTTRSRNSEQDQAVRQDRPDRLRAGPAGRRIHLLVADAQRGVDRRRLHLRPHHHRWRRTCPATSPSSTSTTTSTCTRARCCSASTRATTRPAATAPGQRRPGAGTAGDSARFSVEVLEAELPRPAEAGAGTAAAGAGAGVPCRDRLQAAAHGRARRHHAAAGRLFHRGRCNRPRRRCCRRKASCSRPARSAADQHAADARDAAGRHAGAGPGAAGTGQPQPRLDRDPRAHDGWIDAAQRRARLLRADRPVGVLASSTPEIWITANFKETELARMRPGQPVRIEVDAYPSLKLRGHVDSIQRGSGAAFSAFPPENATGNFVKIVQRVPVKIVIDRGWTRRAAAARRFGGAHGGRAMSGAERRRRRDWKPAGNPWLIAVVVTLAAFMEVLDTTIVNVSLPHIAGNLSASYDDATWALTSYLVANGIVLTISGWLGRVLGRKRYFMICIAMFTVCSFLCGISQTCRADRVPAAAGLLRRRAAAEPAVHHPRHVSRRPSAAARSPSPRSPPSSRRCWARRSAATSPTTRPGAGCSSSTSRSASSPSSRWRAGRGSALGQEAEGQRHRLHRAGADHARPRLPGGHDGPRRGRRLVRLAASSAPWACWPDRRGRRDLLAAHRQASRR